MSSGKRGIVIAAGLLVGAAVAVLWVNRGPSSKPADSREAQADHGPARTRPASATGNRPAASTSQAAPAPAPAVTIPPREPVVPKEVDPVIQAKIEAAVVTYSPTALPVFEKLLASPEPEVREAARDGLLRLGETGGAALLRQAAAGLSDPREIQEMESDAEYLELPPRVGGLKKPAVPPAR